MWADSPRWRPAIPQDEVDRFIESIGQKIRPANAIMLAAKRRVERIHTHRSIRASAPDTVTKVEALKLLNQALQLLRVGMSQVSCRRTSCRCTHVHRMCRRFSFVRPDCV
jgi:hypothetical protein